MKYLYLYIIAAAAFFTLDMIWLGWLTKDLYSKKIGHLMAGSVNWTAALAFYLMFIGGILYFSVIPGLAANDWQKALLNGALFGFFCYATYDLTNLATLRDWPLQIVVLDIFWGIFITGTVALITFLAGQKWFSF